MFIMPALLKCSRKSGIKRLLVLSAEFDISIT